MRATSARECYRNLAWQYREHAALADLRGDPDTAAQHRRTAALFQNALDELEAPSKPALPADPFQGFREPRADKARG
jgi:hypothetical protein